MDKEPKLMHGPHDGVERATFRMPVPADELRQAKPNYWKAERLARNIQAEGEAINENMIKAFKNDEDIHKQAASNVFNIPIDEVTKEQRSHAKAVNFGIVYGISDFGLGEQIGVSRKKAKEYMELLSSLDPQEDAGTIKAINDIVAEEKKHIIILQKILVAYDCVKPDMDGMPGHGKPNGK